MTKLLTGLIMCAALALSACGGPDSDLRVGTAEDALSTGQCAYSCQLGSYCRSTHICVNVSTWAYGNVIAGSGTCPTLSHNDPSLHSVTAPDGKGWTYSSAQGCSF